MGPLELDRQNYRAGQTPRLEFVLSRVSLLTLRPSESKLPTLTKLPSDD